LRLFRPVLIPSCGLSPAIENYPISDGSMLNLAVSTMADRAKTKDGFASFPTRR
jgi:hypothetical protein